MCVFSSILSFIPKFNSNESKESKQIYFTQKSNYVSSNVFRIFISTSGNSMPCIALKHINGHGETYYVSDIGIWKMRSAGFTSGSRLSFPRVAIYGRSIPANCRKTEKKFSRGLKSLSERKIIKSRSIYMYTVLQGNIYRNFKRLRLRHSEKKRRKM